jgi:hypothetical protein
MHSSVFVLTIADFMFVWLVQGLRQLSKIESLGGCSEFWSLQLSPPWKKLVLEISQGSIEKICN